MEKVITQIKQAIGEARASKSNLKGENRLTTPVIRDISKQYYQDIKHLEKSQVLDICEILLASRDGAERIIAFDWAYRYKKHYTEDDFQRFELWLAKYVDDWGSCDDFCSHAFGHLIYRYPAHITQVKAWTQSPNRWFRRAAAVIMIYSARKETHLDAAFEIADSLLMDQDDLVQKGYGWMLKEISKRQPAPVFDYVMAHRATMPRTALRYAIEKLAPELRKQAMQKS
ncbi:MAG: DNA alkylation repair protein [Anaerolineae bacterium]|nr:DNA alkylation repair protein [Anaerolineae bacterium]